MHSLIMSCIKYASPNYIIVEKAWLHTVTVTRFPGCSTETLATQVWTCECNSCSDLYGILCLLLCWEAFRPFGKMSNSCPSKWTGNLFTGRSTFCVKIQAWFFCFFIFPLFIIASCPEAEHSYDALSRTHPYTVRGTLIMGFWYDITSTILET